MKNGVLQYVRLSYQQTLHVLSESSCLRCSSTNCERISECKCQPNKPSVRPHSSHYCNMYVDPLISIIVIYTDPRTILGYEFEKKKSVYAQI